MPPAFFGALYLAALPLFAWAYLGVGDQFRYHDVRLEPVYRETGARACDVLNEAIRQGYRQFWQDERHDAENGTDPMACVTAIDTSSGNCRLSLACIVPDTPEAETPFSLVLIDVIGAVVGGDSSERIFIGFADVPGTTGAAYDEARPCLQRVFPWEYTQTVTPMGTVSYHRSARKADTSWAGVWFDCSDVNLEPFDTLLTAEEGVASGSLASYGRMLYLSAVTITTLGYGDIVPVTALARWLVGTEAVLGVVLAGFFLNAVAQHGSALSETRRRWPACVRILRSLLRMQRRRLTTTTTSQQKPCEPAASATACVSAPDEEQGT